MAEDPAEIQVTLSRPYAVLLAEWLHNIDTSRGLAQGSVPLDDPGAKLALDHLARQLHEVPAIYRGQWDSKVAAARAEVEDRRRRQLQLLVNGLLDRTVDLGTRDDCAMDLVDFDDPAALEALMRVAADADDQWLHDQAGESIAGIVKRHPERGEGLAERMSPGARDAYLHFLKKVE